jgi:ABC-2 type transport system permease protein
MNLRRTLAISRRIADLFRRDHRSLALVFVAPIVIMALLGWVIRDQQPLTTTVAVVNLAGPLGEIGRDRIAAAATDAGYEHRSDIQTEEAARQALADEEINLAIVLAVEAARPTVLILTPGVSPGDDAARVGALRQVLAAAFVDQQEPLIEQETIYGRPDAGFLDAFSPALIGYIVYFLVFILTGISFLRERIGGTLERLLATPVRRLEIVAGYSFGFGAFATVQVALVLAYTLGSIQIAPIGPLPEINIGLGVPSAGSPALAFLITLLLAVSAVNLAIFLSTFARTEFQILQFIPLVIVPQGLLSGIFWPVESLPGVLQPISYALPVTYGIEGLREVLIKGAGLGDPTVQLDVIMLAGISILLAVVATLTIRREVA